MYGNVIYLPFFFLFVTLSVLILIRLDRIFFPTYHLWSYIFLVSLIMMYLLLNESVDIIPYWEYWQRRFNLGIVLRYLAFSILFWCGWWNWGTWTFILLKHSWRFSGPNMFGMKNSAVFHCFLVFKTLLHIYVPICNMYRVPHLSL